VKRHPFLNGIDFLEVVDNRSDPPEKRERILLVHFIKDLAPDSLTAANIRIDGGDRIRGIKVVRATIGGLASPPLASPPAAIQPDVLVVEVDQAGDFSRYTLRLIADRDHPDQPPGGFDPVLAAVDFSFKIGCEAPFDCKQVAICPPQPAVSPEFTYLAKDYASFRQLMLDRMAVLIPQWTERNAADLGIVLIELMAYIGDYLSYEQDAVATEAYLGTARRRISIRRHARLVDYRMHDGSNARTWAYFKLRPGLPSLSLTAKAGNIRTALFTRTSVTGRIVRRDSADYRTILNSAAEPFELTQDVTLFYAHNRMPFYTWGALECCLPKGATRATLNGAYPNLKKGDVLIFEEVRGPSTGVPEDADPTKRCAVRLTNVAVTSDPLGGEFATSPSTAPIPVTEIQWGRNDALPFPICVSASAGTSFFSDVSVARGNIVLADHGLTIENETLDAVPAADPALTVVAPSGDRCRAEAPPLTPPRFRPELKQLPLTQQVPVDASASAADALNPNAADALPQIKLTGPGGDQDVWKPKHDLLDSHSDKKEFVAEVEADGSTYLRFGDGQFGERPASGTVFTATYRAGNGTAGNIGADSLYHIVSGDPVILSDPDPPFAAIRNPLPANSGTDPETIEQVRRYAPAAFRTQERAVTQQDYAEKAKGCSQEIQNAAATFRWTGSWRTVFVTVDRLSAQPVDRDFSDRLLRCLEQYRMAGQDLEVDGPIYVSLEIEMVVCIKPEYFQGAVLTALQDVLSARTLPNGQRGVFHPDNFTFGQTVYLSPIYAAAQEVDGVASVVITRFQRQGIDSDTALKAGKLELSRLEIARLEADPNFPERGKLTLIPKGGR
jgi:hypothetical protein